MAGATVDVTLLSQVCCAVVAYYAVLVQLSRRHVPHEETGLADHPFFVLVVPAHDEEAVLEVTVRRLLALSGPPSAVLVMDDGSRDRTREIADALCEGAEGRLAVITRGPDVAGAGKGAVLNHAFAVLQECVRLDHPFLRGHGADSIVVGVVDADGQLDPDCLERVAPHFADPGVGAVQVGVRIANADRHWLARMQDIEFVGFSGLVQAARHHIGSVGLGGNGQFTRLAALESLGRAPWSDCLSEDLDLGLSLVQRGWDVRFARDAFVAQQGLTEMRPLLRQRARWVQGHYQCWRHLPGLWASPSVPLRAKLDLTAYLTMIVFVLVVSTATALSALAALGQVEVVNTTFAPVPAGAARNAALLLVSTAMPLAFMSTYQRQSAHPLRWWELPAFTAVFCLYGYHWVASQLWAFGRMAGRRRNWAKTPRLQLAEAVP